MKAFKLYCANNTELHPSRLGYSNFQVKHLPLNAQVVDRRSTCIIPDSSRTPLVREGVIALNVGTISAPTWYIYKLPLKCHNGELYIETKHIDNLFVKKLDAKARYASADEMSSL